MRLAIGYGAWEGGGAGGGGRSLLFIWVEVLDLRGVGRADSVCIGFGLGCELRIGAIQL